MHQSSQASQKGLAPLLFSQHRVGHPPLSRALATLGTPKTSLLNDELQLHLHSKPNQSDDQTRFLGLDGDRFVTPKGHPISNAKSEAQELSVDAGLSLGFNPPHHSGLIKTPLGQVTRKWEDDCRNGSHTGPSFAPKTPNEGIVFLQLRQGAATDEDSQDRWDQGTGKPVNSQYNQHQDLSHQSGEVERSPSQAQEHFLALRAEHITNPFTDLSHERSKKRMKRRPLDQAIASYETRELNLPINDKGKSYWYFRRVKLHPTFVSDSRCWPELDSITVNVISVSAPTYVSCFDFFLSVSPLAVCIFQLCWFHLVSTLQCCCFRRFIVCIND